MFEVDKLNYSEYVEQLKSYVERYLSADEVVELLAGESIYTSKKGVEAMEDYVMQSFMFSKSRPPASSPSVYAARVETAISELPPRMQKRVLQSELDVWRNSMGNGPSLWSEIELLEVAERKFDVDMTDEIVETAQHIDESESKLDLLEERDVIDGDEWYDRHEQLEASA